MARCIMSDSYGSVVGLTRNSVAGLTITLVVAALFAGPVSAQLSESEFRADDGTAYQILRAVAPLGVGAEALRITTLSGSSTGVGGCVLSQNMRNQIAAAIAGPLPPGQTLHPYDQIARTAILTPNDITAVAFDQHFGGRVTLGTGGAALNICKSGFDCSGQSNIQSLVGLSSASGGVPAACIGVGVSAGTQCDGSN